MIDTEVLQRVSETLAERKKASPDSSYVSSLYAKGTDAICKTECAATVCATPPAKGDMACSICIQAAVAAGGACNAPVMSACTSNAKCVAWAKCNQKC